MKDILTYNNCLFVHDQINEKLSNTFAEYFIIASNQHSSEADLGLLQHLRWSAL